MNDTGPAQSHAPRRSWRTLKRVGFFVGLLLLAAAAAYLLADPEALRDFAHRIAHAPAWAACVVVLGPLANWVFVSMCLHALNTRHGDVGRGEMMALVGSAWLLNHLPMRPGLVGRIGYHAKVNSIRVRDSVEASIWSMIHAAIANALALGLMLLVSREIGIGALTLVLAAPLGALGVLAALAGLRSARLGLLMMGLVWRYADLMVWMVRYAAAFAMLGVEITPVQIALITAVSQIAQVIPITGGGLGFREWGVGITARMSAHGAAIPIRLAIGADVINRIAETLTVIPLGLVCTGIVARRFSRHRARSDQNQPLHGPTPQELSTKDETVGHPGDQDQPGQPGQQHPADG